MTRIAVLVALIAGAARASSPVPIYTFPVRVDFLPDEANATEVVIHGAFTLLVNAKGGFAFDKPQCGTMYFKCKANELAMCRMQWKEIRDQIGKVGCMGFGTNMMITTATIRGACASPKSPDTYDIGMGTTVGVCLPGVNGGCMCSDAKALGCMVCPPDMGVPSDLRAPTPDLATAKPDLAAPKADLAMTAKPDLSSPPAADLATTASPDLATTASPDLATPESPDLAAAAQPDLRKPVADDLAKAPSPDLSTVDGMDMGGCKCSVGRPAGGGFAALAMLVGAALLLARRRRRA